MPNREAEAQAAFLKATEVNPTSANNAYHLGQFLAGFPARLGDAQRVLNDALDIDPTNANIWSEYGFVLACRGGQIDKAEAAFRRAGDLNPNCAEAFQNLGILLFCERGQEKEGIEYLRLACRPDLTDPVSADVTAVIRMACVGDSDEIAKFFAGETRPGMWNRLLEFCSDYAPFGKILLRLCNLVLEVDPSNEQSNLYRAVALAQIRDFPRALVALEDALLGDPIDQLAKGRTALEIFFAAAVRNDRTEECREIIARKNWIDAWRPIYEALKAVEAGSARYLKKIAVEIREPATLILKRIAPELPGSSEDEARWQG